MTDAARRRRPALRLAAQPPRHRRRRYAADRRLRVYGIAAIALALGLLGILLATLVISGYPAFTQTKVRVDFPISADLVDPADPAEGNFRKVVAGRRRRPSPRRAQPRPSCARSATSSPTTPSSWSATPSSRDPR